MAFILGMFVGAFFGVMTFAVAQAAKEEGR